MLADSCLRALWTNAAQGREKGTSKPSEEAMRLALTIDKRIVDVDNKLGRSEEEPSYATKKGIFRTVKVPMRYYWKNDTHIMKATVGSGTGYSEIFCTANLKDNGDNTTTICFRSFYGLIYRVLIYVILSVALYYSGELLVKAFASQDLKPTDLRTLLNALAPILLGALSALVYSNTLDRYSKLMIDHWLEGISTESGKPGNA
jgi:hypothetical protein